MKKIVFQIFKNFHSELVFFFFINIRLKKKIAEKNKKLKKIYCYIARRTFCPLRIKWQMGDIWISISIISNIIFPRFWYVRRSTSVDDSNERAKFADPRQYRKSGWIIRREDDVGFPCAQQRNAGNMRGMRKLLILKEKEEKERERGVVGSCKHEEESMFANKVVIPGHLLFGRYQQPTSWAEQSREKKEKERNLMNIYLTLGGRIGKKVWNFYKNENFIFDGNGFLMETEKEIDIWYITIKNFDNISCKINK